jgi:hypothetical protein
MYHHIMSAKRNLLDEGIVRYVRIPKAFGGARRARPLLFCQSPAILTAQMLSFAVPSPGQFWTLADGNHSESPLFSLLLVFVNF